MKKGFAPIPVVILIAVCLVLAYVFVGPKIQNQGGMPTFEKTGSTETGPSVSTPEPKPGWKTYENLELRLRFQYPPESTIEELFGLGPNYFQINLRGEDNLAQGIFMVKTAYEPEDVQDFVGSSPQGTKDIAGQTWYFFDFPEGYSNSPPFTVYQNEKGDYLYGFKFHNFISDDLRDEIMATVEITP